MKVKRTFLQVALDEELSPRSRRPARKTCPDSMFEADSEDESEYIAAKASGPVAVPQWLGGAVTVKNTFISVALDHEQQDEELILLQAARRRDVQSCPYICTSTGHDDKEAILTPTNDDDVPQMELSFGIHPPVSYINECLKDALRVPPEASCVHRRVSTRELGLLNRLLGDDLCGSAYDAPVSTLPSVSPDLAEGNHGRQIRGLDLTSVPSNYISECYGGCMEDVLTPIVHGSGALVQHHAETATFFPESLTHAASSARSKRGTDQAVACAAEVLPKYAVSASPKLAEQEVRALPQLSSGRTSRRSGRGGLARNRLWCHVFLDPLMLEAGFDLVKKIIGRSGCNTRKIFEATQTKVRVRGWGSGHKEHHNGREAPVPLMIALAAEHGSADDFQSAFNMTKELLHDISQRFEVFLSHQQALKHEFNPTTRRFWVGDISHASKLSLGDSMKGMM